VELAVDREHSFLLKLLEPVVAARVAEAVRAVRYEVVSEVRSGDTSEIAVRGRPVVLIVLVVPAVGAVGAALAVPAAVVAGLGTPQYSVGDYRIPCVGT